MKGRDYISIIAAAVLLGATVLLGAGALVINQSRISPQAIASSVTRTPALIERAWRLPVAARFGRQIIPQSNPSRCGPASVANTYRSLEEPANTEDRVLAGTGRCWTGLCILGLTLNELAEVAQTNTSRRITVLRDLSEDRFRDHLRHSNDLNRRYIVNFTRQAIFGNGVGHHSPIGGYLETEDLVFVLDVNPDYQPWLVEASRLFAAVNTFDGQKKRGLLLIQ
jgi:phytochelatin synthase